jgi:hypothetical protein
MAARDGPAKEAAYTHVKPMSSTEAIPTNLPDLADLNDVHLSGGGPKTWRFQFGKIVTGRGKPEDADNTLEFRKDNKVVGRLLRVGIHKGVTGEYNKPYEQLEIDVEVQDDKNSPPYVIGLKSNLLNQETNQLGVTRGTIDFAYGIAHMPVGGVIGITARLGDAWVQKTGPKAGQKMSPSTYVNVFKLEQGTDGRWQNTELRKPPKSKDDTTSLNDQWLALEPLIRARADFAPRPEPARGRYGRRIRRRGATEG